MRFFTDFQLSPGGPVSKFVDSVEVMTDKNGEFEIPRQKLHALRFFHGWDTHGSVIIFKPGYGAYPGHKDVGPRFKPGGTLPEGEYVVVWLPKLENWEERKKNLRNIPNINAPQEKYKKLREMEKNETDLIFNHKK